MCVDKNNDHMQMSMYVDRMYVSRLVIWKTSMENYPPIDCMNSLHIQQKWMRNKRVFQMNKLKREKETIVRDASCECVENWLVLTRFIRFQPNKYTHPSYADRTLRHEHERTSISAGRAWINVFPCLTLYMGFLSSNGGGMHSQQHHSKQNQNVDEKRAYFIWFALPSDVDL